MVTASVHRTLSPKQETFAQLVGAADKGIADAYKEVYPNARAANTTSQGVELINKPHVAARVKELRDKRASKVVYTIDIARTMLLAIANDAKAEGKYGPAISALAEADKISGFHVQRIELDAHITATDNRLATFTTEELRALIEAGRAGLLGDSLPPQLAIEGPQLPAILDNSEA